MCGDCMTGHFQVVITERHVKNLCCPNCQEPNIDDVTKETIYLEFLAQKVGTAKVPRQNCLFLCVHVEANGRVTSRVVNALRHVS